VVGGLTLLSFAWACGGKELAIQGSDGGGGGVSPATEDVVGEDATPPREGGDDTSSEDFETGSEDDGFFQDGGDDTGSEDDGSFQDGFDASDGASDAELDAEFDAGGSCVESPGTISVTSSGCMVSLMETCGSTAYQATCSCPHAKCTCTEMTPTGAAGSEAPYAGCGSKCGDLTLPWVSCGFPVP
jgi:hypothetical protein